MRLNPHMVMDSVLDQGIPRVEHVFRVGGAPEAPRATVPAGILAVTLGRQLEVHTWSPRGAPSWRVSLSVPGTVGIGQPSGR